MYVVWSVCVQLCWTQLWALQTWLNQSRCRLGYGLRGGPREPCARWGPDFPTGRGKSCWQIDVLNVIYKTAAAICASTVVICCGVVILWTTFDWVMQSAPHCVVLFHLFPLYSSVPPFPSFPPPPRVSFSVFVWSSLFCVLFSLLPYLFFPVTALPPFLLNFRA